MNLKEQILGIFPEALRHKLKYSKIDFLNLREIRLRVNKPVILYIPDELFLGQAGTLTASYKDAVCVGMDEIKQIMEFVCNFSLYAFSEELLHGYVTIRGGHRIGICGSFVMEGGKIKCVKHISSINIRIAHDIYGCSEKIMKYLYNNGCFQNTLIVSGCGKGKTTLLRDIIRNLSNGYLNNQGKNVAVIDERSELGACWQGIAQNDLGLRTDILEGCSKTSGMEMLIRSMSPEIIALDEVGFQDEFVAIKKCIISGCKLIATVHADSFECIKKNELIKNLIGNEMINRFVILKSDGPAGIVEQIFDSKGGDLYKNN